MVGSNSKNTASCEYFRDIGLDALLRNFKASRVDKEILDNCCISLSNTNVSLLPGTSKLNRDSFENDMNYVFLNLLRTIEALTGIVFIDINSGNNSLSMKIAADCDLTVVNLSQNIGLIDAYLTGNNLIASKVFYLFGNYDTNSKYNIHNLRRKYHKHIKISNSGVIPYNTMFLDAQSDGRVIDFFRENLLCSKKDDNNYFIKQSQKTTSKILNMLGLSIMKEEGIITEVGTSH